MLRQPDGCWAQVIHSARLSMIETRDMRNISFLWIGRSFSSRFYKGRF